MIWECILPGLDDACVIDKVITQLKLDFKSCHPACHRQYNQRRTTRLLPATLWINRESRMVILKRLSILTQAPSHSPLFAKLLAKNTELLLINDSTFCYIGREDDYQLFFTCWRDFISRKMYWGIDDLDWLGLVALSCNDIEQDLVDLKHVTSFGFSVTVRFSGAVEIRLTEKFDNGREEEDRYHQNLESGVAGMGSRVDEYYHDLEYEFSFQPVYCKIVETNALL